MNGKRAAIVLAAGKGTRMKSELPKVLHPIYGKPMIQHVVETLQQLKLDKIIIVIGYKGEMVEEALAGYPVEFVWQLEQNGTGHAVMVAADNLAEFEGETVIALGDVPFLKASTVQAMFDKMAQENSRAVCLTARVAEPKGYGRIVRDDQQKYLQAIVEAKDASEEILKINEINTGTFCFDNQLLFDTLKHIKNDNAQNEYYLTDCVKLMYDKGMPVSVVVCDDPDEGEGINSVDQLELLAEKFENKS